jgi:glycosyltransferase involved in cell wall biosynthesis
MQSGMIPRSTVDRPVVCQVLHSLHVGGAEVLAAALARQLADQFQFVFACLDDLGPLGEELRQEGFPVEVLHRQAGWDLACARRLARWVADCGAHLIQAHQYTPFFYARLPVWLGRRPPVLFTEHGRFHPDRPNPRRMLFNRLFLRPCDRVVAVGRSVKQALIDNEGIPAERIEVIYNGVPLARLAGVAALRQQVREELGISPAAAVAILVARLDPIKDHGTALAVAARLRQTRPDFKLLIVGDGPLRADLEARVKAMELGDTVQMLGLRTDVPRLLAAADLFLLTSLSEGIPVTLIEAMGAGLPVVATRVGGVPEVVVDGQTGLLADASDADALAAAVRKLLTDATLRQRLAMAGQARAAALFSQQAMHAAYARLYREMLGLEASTGPDACRTDSPAVPSGCDAACPAP